MAGADTGQGLQQKNAGLLQKPGEAEPTTQLKNHGTNRGRVDAGVSLGGPYSMPRNRVRGEDLKVQTLN
jgi:hypothetical protein